jgi:hypothetical protein
LHLLIMTSLLAASASTLFLRAATAARPNAAVAQHQRADRQPRSEMTAAAATPATTSSTMATTSGPPGSSSSLSDKDLSQLRNYLHRIGFSARPGAA